MLARRPTPSLLVAVLRRAGRSVALPAVLALATAGAGPCGALAADVYLDGVRSFVPGTFAGFGQDELPGIVLGPPQGFGALAGSTDAVSLGNGGSITVVFRDNVVFDGPGDDLVVFENAFHSGSESGPIFDEVGIVQVSPDRRAWYEFPYDAETGEGLAGRTPVFADGENGIDPVAPEAGGDRFDIGDLGLSFVRFVRILDPGADIADAGNFVPPGTKGGFDLDAMAAVHSVAPAVVRGSVSASGLPVARARVKLIPLGSDEPRRRQRRRTRADGTFKVWPVLPTGDYLVKVRRRGVGRDAQPVYVDTQQRSVDLELRLD